MRTVPLVWVGGVCFQPSRCATFTQWFCVYVRCSVINIPTWCEILYKIQTLHACGSCCGAIWLICISLGSSPPEAYYVLCAVWTNCIKWTHTVETVSAECLSSHFICVIKQITIKFSICVFCKCCHVNFILLVVNQVWPLLRTKPNFKLNVILIWSSLFMAKDIHIVVFCVTRSRVAKYADVNPKGNPPLVYVNTEICYISSSPVHPYLHSTLLHHHHILSDLICFCLLTVIMQFLLINQNIWTLCLDELRSRFRQFEWVLTLEYFT